MPESIYTETINKNYTLKEALEKTQWTRARKLADQILADLIKFEQEWLTIKEAEQVSMPEPPPD